MLYNTTREKKLVCCVLMLAPSLWNGCLGVWFLGFASNPMESELENVNFGRRDIVSFEIHVGT